MRITMQEIVENQYGEESHPAFALISAAALSHGPTGAVLFDSEIHHHSTVLLSISTASRKRDLHSDHMHAGKSLIQVEMSPAQWAGFVSSFGRGQGVPCTLRYHDGTQVPELPFESRLQRSADETREAAEQAMKEVAEAFAAYKDHKTAANLRSLQATIDNLPSNISFAAKSLSEHAENVVQKTRGDIEAMFAEKALGALTDDTNERHVLGEVTEEGA